MDFETVMKKLNKMEHRGFSSSIIKGITTSSEKAKKLYQENEK